MDLCTFKSMVETINAKGDVPWLCKKLYDQYLQEQEAVTAHVDITGVVKGAMDDTKEQVTTKTADNLSFLFMCTSGNRRYHALKLDLVDKHLLGDDKYPKTLEGCNRFQMNTS